jgi:hypothetical protein
MILLSEPVDAVGRGVDIGLLAGDKVGDQVAGRRGAGGPNIFTRSDDAGANDAPSFVASLAWLHGAGRTRPLG